MRKILTVFLLRGIAEFRELSHPGNYGEERVAKAELGLKRVCLGCGARFYDLNKIPAFCPYCGKEFDPSAPSRSSRSRQSEVIKTQSKKVQEDESKQTEGSSPTERKLEDGDKELEDIDMLDSSNEDDEIFDEDTEEEDELIVSIDNSGKNNE